LGLPAFLVGIPLKKAAGFLLQSFLIRLPAIKKGFSLQSLMQIEIRF